MPVAVVVLLAMFTGRANALCSAEDAALVGDGIKNFSILTLGSPTTLRISGPSNVVGIIGIASHGQYVESGPSAVTGSVLLGDHVVPHVSSRTKPAIFTNQDPFLNPLVSQVLDPVTGLGAAAAQLKPDISVPGGELSGNLTICDQNYLGVGGLHCDVVPTSSPNGPNCHDVDLTGVELKPGAKVTIYSQSTSASFTINDSGPFAIGRGSQIALGGVLSQEDVLFNVTGKGRPVTITGANATDVANDCDFANASTNSQIEGIFFAPQRTVILNPGLVCGEVIAGGLQMAIASGAAVVNNEAHTPTPRDSDRNCHSHCDGNSNRDGHGYRDCNCDRHGHCDCDQNRNCNRYSDQDSHGDGNRDSDRYPHGDAYA